MHRRKPALNGREAPFRMQRVHRGESRLNRVLYIVIEPNSQQRVGGGRVPVQMPHRGPHANGNPREVSTGGELPLQMCRGGLVEVGPSARKQGVESGSGGVVWG